MKLFLIILSLAALAAGQESLECPFPEGQDVSSEAECARYSACVWSGSACSMDTNGVIGYRVASDPVDTGRGFTVNLEQIDSSKTMFDADIPNLQFEVIYHEDYHVQVKITDAAASRYEVPVPLNFPEEPGTAPLYTVSVSETGQPFSFSVSRTSTGTNVFSTYGALTFEDQFIQFSTLLSSTYMYGFGENTHTSFRHRFDSRSTWPIFAKDQPVGGEYINHYGTHPYYMTVEDDEGNSNSVLFFNSNAMEYSTFTTSEGDAALTLRTIGGIIDLHFFLGPTPEDVNIQYATTVGKAEFPPYWSLGFHLSRYGYVDTAEIRTVRDRMRAAGIPQEVQTFDIDYMERFRDFTYDPVNYADLPQLIDELHAENIKVTLILDPAIVIDWNNYPPAVRGRDADAFIKWSTPDLIPGDQPAGASDYMIGYVWPDDKTAFPDFFKPSAREWWANETAILYEKLPFDALWIDMNEPANFGTDLEKPWNWPEGQAPWSLKCPYNKWDSPPYPTMTTRVGNTESFRLSDHTICLSGSQTDGVQNFMMYDVHNLYGWAETTATYEAMNKLFPNKRQVVLSRSTFPGSGKQAVHWLGDNTSAWDHLVESIIGMLEFNLFASPMVGADICGFFGDTTIELCSRWMQAGAFYPFSRNHNGLGSIEQDPAVDPTLAAISRDALLLRYKYLPYLYSLFHMAHMGGHSVVRPLLNVFPQDLVARDVDDQFLWGDAFMVAPVMQEGAVNRPVYFPQGLWYDVQTYELVSSTAGEQTVDAPLEKVPVYARGGYILPTQEPALTTVESRLNPFNLNVFLDESGMAMGELFYDDGDEEHMMMDTFMAMYTFSQNVLTTTINHGQDLVGGLVYESVTIIGLAQAPTDVLVNNSSAAFSYDGSISVLMVTAAAPLSELLTVSLVY